LGLIMFVGLSLGYVLLLVLNVLALRLSSDWLSLGVLVTGLEDRQLSPCGGLQFVGRIMSSEGKVVLEFCS